MDAETITISGRDSALGGVFCNGGSGERMKILHIYRMYFPDPPGGLQEAIRQISLSTRNYGVESQIFTLSPEPVPQCIRYAEGLVTRAKSWAAPASCDIGGLDAFRQFRKLADWADVLHFHFPWPFADVLHLLGGKSKPSVMTYHSDIVRQRVLGAVYGPLMRSTLRSMSAVVATSPEYARTSQILANVVSPERIKTIPLGLADYRDEATDSLAEANTLCRLGINEGPFFLALGVLRYYKGLHTLIQAAPSVGAKIVIAGSGPEMNNLSMLAKQVGANNVVFAGQVSHAEKVALLRGCRALALPSHLRSEAFGMVLVEAAMFGKPLVCCDVGSGTSHVNKHGVTGIIVKPENPRELASALSELLSDSALTQRMGYAARERYERLFSAPALGHAYVALYKEVMVMGEHRGYHSC
jgi:glycosyltransferase involved in cell wall biosynthesis